MNSLKELQAALQKHYTKEGLLILSTDIDKLTEQYLSVLDKTEDDETANEHIAVLSGLKLILDELI